MATKGELSLKGLEQWLEALAAAGEDVDLVADEMLIAGGDVLLEGEQRRAPVDTHNLADHLEVTGPVVEGNEHIVRVGLAPDTDADTARYGNAQEYGWDENPGQPYIRPTFDIDGVKARKVMVEVAKEKGVL